MDAAQIPTPDRYASGRYLVDNQDWHEADSPYKARRVIRALGAANPRTIVDVGCGAGRVAEIIANHFADSAVFGFDPSPDASRFWQCREGVDFRCANIFDTDERFDVALCLDVIEHVEDVFGFLRNLRRRADRFVFNIPLDMCIVKLVGGGLRRVRDRVGHIHYFNRFSAGALLLDCGYHIESEELITPLFDTLPRNSHQWLAAAPRMAVSAVSPTLAATCLGGYSLLVVAD